MAQNDFTIIASRVESLEGRLDDSIEKINSRLDAIVDLMQKVTALQEREISNGVQITELKVAIKETNQTIKDWNKHIHERMDRHYTDIKICREGIDATISNVEEEIQTKMDKIQSKADTTQEELAKWLNRGIGAWSLAAALLVILQGAGAYVISGIIDANSKKDEHITKLEQRLSDNEKEVTLLGQIVKDNKQVINTK